MASPKKLNGGIGASLRMHPRSPPPLHMNYTPPPPAASAGYPYMQVPHRSRMSPRQVKLQRMEPSLPYTLAVPLRDQVASNFRHELFQFHQLLRDTIESNRRDVLKHVDAHRSSIMNRDQSVLKLLTSDRGDAVLKEFFAQWQRYLKTKRLSEKVSQGDEGDGAVLWDVLETFFGSLPFSVSESEPDSPKKFLRYIDSLNLMRELLVALLFKPLPAREKNDIDQGDSDEEGHGLESSIGLGFGLDFSSKLDSAQSSPRQTHQSFPTDRNNRIPLYLYCQQLESELEALRRRVPHRKHHSAETVAGVVGDVGLLQDSTVMLLLDFWTLPHEERLAFFCQIASQANEEDASSILHVFLDNCTTQTFLQVWEALQQSLQFQKMLREAALQLGPATDGEEAAVTTNATSEDRSTLEIDTFDLDRPGWRGSQRNMIKKRPRRSTRFVDFNGITEAFDHNEDGGDSDEEGDGGDTFRDSPRSQKITIRERGRLSLSNASDQPTEHDQTSRPHLLRHNSRSRRHLKSPRTGESSASVLERIHDNLTELIKMEDGPDAQVMDAVWQLLEALDGQHSKSGYHRRGVTLPAPGPITHVPSQPLQVLGQNPRTSLRTPLSAEQQFIMKLDQLQSMLVALSEVRIYSMSTDTITAAYRRIPALAKLFSALTDASLGAAGIDTTGGGLLKIVSSYSKAQNIASSWQGGSSKEKTLDPLKASPGTPNSSAESATEDKAREDVEAMGLLLNKISKFVRSLTPLVDNEDEAPSDVSASNDVLMVLDLASKLESAGTLAEVPPPCSKGGGGKRRLSLAADRELPIILAVQSLARSNDFDDVSRLILASVVAKISRVRTAALEEKANGEDENEDGVTMEGDEEVMKIVKNLRRASAKAAQIQEVHDQMQLQLQGGAVSSEADVAALRLTNRDIPSNIKNSTILRGLKLFRVDILLRIVNQLYRDSYEGMVATLQYGTRRMEFSEFIYDWHIRKYGLKALAQRHLLKLIQSLRKHEKKAFQCQLPLGFHEHKFVLGLLSRWSAGTFSGGSKHRIALSKRQFKIRITFAISTVQEALRERFGIFGRGIDAMVERIRAKTIPRDEEFVRENDLLIISVEEFASQRALLEKVLGAVYLAGDINGDGSLEFDEFASVVTHLSPTVDDRFLQKVFEAAHDFSKPHRISFARFLDVVLLERVLSPVALSAAASGAMRAKSAAAISSSSSTGTGSAVGAGSQQASGALKVVLQDEQEETYQFELLRETWTHDREAVTHVLQTSITHAPTAKSLTFRVAFLDQLLERRVDSKTAWLCHRQIMREIARYQHLDAEQVAGLRNKEQQFKKTVRAIRNAQRLSTLFAAPVVDRETSGGELAVSGTVEVTPADTPSPSPSYTATVRFSIEGGMTDLPNVADVAALENELRETFLERADERAIDDYMAAMQHLRRVTIKQQSLMQESREDMTLLRSEEAVHEEDEESDDDDDDEKEKDKDDGEAEAEEDSDDDEGA